MSSPSLTVFTNFRINDEERLLRMKDSFFSFKDIDAVKWVINVRGKYAQETLSFLQDYLGDKLSGHTIESGKGWFHDSRTLVSEINSDYVMYWVEDHINMTSVESYSSILSEMQESKSQFLFSSWFVLDQKENAYDGISRESYNNIDTLYIDSRAAKKITKRSKLHFIISALGIFDKTLFYKLINTNHPKIRRWPKETPFDLEKRVTDYFWLPLRISLPKFELFAPIDDDIRGYTGSSLQSRGLYPLRVTRESLNSTTTSAMTPVGRLYNTLPASMRWFLKNLFIRPYTVVKHYLLRVSYHL